MYTIVIAIAVSLVVIVAVTIAFEREVSTFQSFMILLVVYSATRIILRALARRGGRV